MNGTKIPHGLRFAAFLLRVALGLNFLYLGIATLFNPALVRELRERSLTDLYAWVGSSGLGRSFQMPLEWAFLLIGAFLIIGFATRFVSFAGIAIAIASLIPQIQLGAFQISQFVNDGVIVILCLLVIALANAGSYLGVDMFIHVHLSSQHNKK